ncbi:DNA methyltransferase [Thermococcus sp.]|uniref:DNA methyltransferase n=1 Tax=Thermococcus sp. TaxID=35749 RepID=UPI00262FBCFE|nr:DNA methyltransferase [Thermococcus sp.]
MDNIRQQTLLEYVHSTKINDNVTWRPNDTNFVDNMSLPIHRWFRFPAGFSAEWVKKVIKWRLTQQGDNDITVLDPFAGTGTTILAAEELGIRAYGIEAHPFIGKIATIKLSWKDVNINNLNTLAMKVLNAAKSKKWELVEYPSLIRRMYPTNVLEDLNSLRLAWQFYNDDSPESKIIWLAITAILRQTSNKGTAPWQYVLPNKKKKTYLSPYLAFQKQISIMIQDIEYFQKNARPTGALIQDDIRYTHKIPSNSVDLIITSPPYANNYDYADAVRLELSFWGEVNTWRDLHEKARKYLIRSCTQHFSYENVKLEQLLNNLKHTPIYDDLKDVCYKLAEERLKHGGKKKYHLMVAAYFYDLYLALKNMRRMCKQDCTMAIVIGDSAPYGIYVPVEEWLGRLAIHVGFNKYYFEKIRDRNIKWKTRKHNVPLKEGILWVR